MVSNKPRSRTAELVELIRAAREKYNIVVSIDGNIPISTKDLDSYVEQVKLLIATHEEIIHEINKVI